MAWKSIYQARKIDALSKSASGKEYHCPTCVLPERDLKNGCPKCELTISFEVFKRDIRKEILKRFRLKWDSKAWPFDKCTLDQALGVHQVVSRMLSRNDGQIDLRWDETVVAAAEIILSERSRATANDG